MDCHIHNEPYPLRTHTKPREYKTNQHNTKPISQSNTFKHNKFPTYIIFCCNLRKIIRHTSKQKNEKRSLLCNIHMGIINSNDCNTTLLTRNNHKANTNSINITNSTRSNRRTRRNIIQKININHF